LTYRNLFVTMLLGGLWHGAAWTFVIWGALHGAGLAAERLLRERAGVRRVPAVLAVILVFHFVCAAWIFFRAQTFDLAAAYFAGLAALTWDMSLVTPFLVGMVALPLALQFAPPDLVSRTASRLRGMPVLAAGLLVGMAIVLIQLVSPPGTAPFIYFQF
jgi:hypothetical protein